MATTTEVNMKDVRAILVRAKELVTSGWTQFWYACDEDGSSCDSFSNEARCWCSHGALTRSRVDLDCALTSRSEASEIFRVANDIENITIWNDAPERTQSEVIAAFEKAIAYVDQLLAA
jgi:hypothetical protein